VSLLVYVGCPQNIAKRGNYGAYLLQDKTLSLQLLSAMASEIDCPVTVKIRLYDDPQDTVALCHSIEQCGIQMITVHGRTLHEKKQYVREANWTVLKDIKESGVTIPIVANGGVSCYADVIKCLEETKVDAVMSSEALLENPKLFSPKGDLDFRENYIQSQLVTIREYLSLVEQYPTPHSFITVVKAHLFKMMYRFITAPKNHDLRQTLGACQEYTTMVKVVEEVERRVSVFAGHDLEAVGSGYLSSNTWYERHLLT
jgi:tRNA-dihydrouridine synthase